MAQTSDDALSKELLFLLAENTNDVVWTMSVAGEITYVSPSVERMRGITPDEARRQPLDEILQPDSAAIVAGYFQNLYSAMAEGREPPANFRGELEYNCADGSTVWAEVQVMPRYGPNGELLEILGVSRDISELRAQRAAIREAQIEAERQQTLVDERERMARDLHDDLLQALSAANLQIATAELRAGDDGGTREALSRSREDLQAAIDGARRLVTGLRARQLEGRSLGDAILGLADDLSARTGAATALEVDDIGEIDAHAEDALFRVAQEALANVAKHASAATVQIHLEREGESIVLSIVDDGRGIDSREPVRADSYGLTGMRERVHAVGGSVSVESGSHGGTCVVARVPAESQLSALPRAVR